MKRALIVMSMLSIPWLVVFSLLPPAEERTVKIEIAWLEPTSGDFVVRADLHDPLAKGTWEDQRQCRLAWNLGGRLGVATMPHFSVVFLDYDRERDRILAVHKRGVESVDPTSGTRTTLWDFDERGALLFGWARRDRHRLLVPGMEFTGSAGGTRSSCFLGQLDLRTLAKTRESLGPMPTGFHAEEDRAYTILGDEFLRLDWDDDGVLSRQPLGVVLAGWTVLGLLKGVPVFRSADHAQIIYGDQVVDVEGLATARTVCLPKALVVLTAEGRLHRLTTEGRLEFVRAFEGVNGFGRSGDSAWISQSDGTVVVTDSAGAFR